MNVTAGTSVKIARNLTAAANIVRRNAQRCPSHAQTVRSAIRKTSNVTVISVVRGIIIAVRSLAAPTPRRTSASDALVTSATNAASAMPAVVLRNAVMTRTNAVVRSAVRRVSRDRFNIILLPLK